MPKRDYYFPQRNLVDQNTSELVQRNNIPRSRFVGTKTRKTAFGAGILCPFLIDEVLPGDHLTYDVTAFVRMATALWPILDNQVIETFFFYTPSRILWANWKRFMGEQPTGPSDSIAFTVPIITLAAANVTVNSIYDHMGMPAQITAGQTIDVNALPFRAYNMIYNEWFRDQNIQTAAPINNADGPDNAVDYAMRRRGKSHDYFTSALPWPQKFTAPSVPVAGNAPIIGIGYDTGAGVTAGPYNAWETDKTAATSYANYQWTSQLNGLLVNMYAPGGGGQNKPLIYADLSQATGVAINTLRQAFMIQTLLERDARGGTRYTEQIFQQFGVRNPDYRLQRPEYIGGGRTPLVITPVAQTATGGGGLGSLGGVGTSAATGHHASYAATEYGYVIGIINVRSEISYQQGLHKLWTRSTRYDFYVPALAQLGEQAVLRQEIYCTGVNADDATVFGYQERWHEYRVMYSDVTGIMRSSYAGTLDAWHLAQNFSSAPVLDSTFILDSPPMTRVLAAGGASANQEYLADILIRRTAVRPVPTFSTPATLGRF